jgi:16S rRNA (adenine1518-N6/adenine1519-N6)-dimethyltransferase
MQTNPVSLPNESEEHSLMAQTRELLRDFDLRARKKLGQHFLVNRGVLKRIILTAELSKQDIVVEVGPGLGILTRELALNAGQVIAIELDRQMFDLLKQTMAPFSNFTLVNEDILNIEPAALMNELKLPEEKKRTYKVVANLPYYITQPALRHFLEASFKPEMMVVMVQKEVARKITAAPGDMSILSVSVQLYGKPEIIGYVPARYFFPEPKVDSAILKIDIYKEPIVSVPDVKTLFKVVRAGFSSKRKQVLNSLAQGLRISRSDALLLLDKSEIDPQRRAQTLNLEEWARLCRNYAEALI